MKLTKGKISKLYNKKKQTMKRKVNKKKGSNKNRTFRRKQKMNLARKSLKRLRYNKLSGGTDDVPKTDEELGIFPPVATVEENVTVPLEETSTLNPPLNEELNVMPPGITTDVLTGDADVMPTDITNDVITGDADVMPTDITTDVITGDADVMPTDITTDVITGDADVMPVEGDVNEEDYQVNVEPTDADLLAQENAAQEYNETNTEKPSIETKITDLVETIANETAKKIEEKLTDTEQNPAYAVTEVANRFGNETAAAAGVKKRRSRKFRLLKKQNRTKRT